MQGSLFTPPSGANILPFDGEAFLYPYFFSEEESNRYFDHLLAHIEWKQDYMTLYGRQVALPRLTAWYGEPGKDYSYSGMKQTANHWTPKLLEIKAKIEAETKVIFNSVLLNLYRSGDDHVSWHRDNEKVLRVNPVIASVSFGATRTFRLRHISDKKLVKRVELSNGTFLLMQGETQHKWEHQIMKTKSVNSPRINLTFRVL